MEDDGHHSNWVIYTIIIIIIGIIVFWLFSSNSNKPESFSSGDISSYTTSKRDYWDLSIYSSENPDTDYLIEKIKGFATKSACIEAGLSKTSTKGSYECGYKCKTQYTQIKDSKNQVDICEKVCDAGGCRD